MEGYASRLPVTSVGAFKHVLRAHKLTKYSDETIGTATIFILGRSFRVRITLHHF
jgi:hypothetical protein